MISFLGVRTDGQTDRHGFGILTWKHVGTQKIQLKAQNSWFAVDPYMPPRRSGMHKYPDIKFSKLKAISLRNKDTRISKRTQF